MAQLDTIQVTGNNFVDIGTKTIQSLIAVNTYSADVEFDLAIGPTGLHDGTATTNAIFVLKNIPIPIGSSFVWDDDGTLEDAFKGTSSITKYNASNDTFEAITSGFTFLLRASNASETVSVLMRRK